MRSILFAAVAAVFALTAGFTAHAGELDNEKAPTTEQVTLAQQLPKTVVVRVKAGTNEAEVLQSNQALAGDDVTKVLVSTSSFVKVDSTGKVAGELDRDSSSSSWYFCCPWNNYYGGNYGYYPQYYYGGYQYSYSSYYSYYYSGYNYYYYGYPYGGYNPYCGGNNWW